MIAPNYLAKHIVGFNVIDCDIRDRNTFYLLARRDYTQDPSWNDSKEPPSEGRLQKRALSLRLNNPDEKKWGVARLDGLDMSLCAMTFRPEANLVVMDIASKVWMNSTATNGFEPPMQAKYQGGLLAGAITKLKCFGEHVFSCAHGRGIFVRHDVSSWHLVGNELTFAYVAGTSRNFGFEDFDAVSPTDVVAVGGAGDVWEFNGQTWRQCAFPTTWGLSAVCCGGDGEVYVCAGGGTIYRGRGDRWTRVAEGDFTLPFKDMVWYEDKLWCTSDYGLWTFDGKSLEEADVPSGVKICSGNLATRDGVLLVAGYGGAAFKRDGQWTEIFHDYALRELASKPK